jgi:2-iminobutanoate/2-iminopropanoate deaminase
MGKRALQPGGVRARGSYSPGWEVSGGRLVFVAGQVPWDANGQTVARGDPAGQARQVFENVRAVLAEAGATLADVVKLTIFITDVRHRDAINQVRSEVFQPPYPSSTQVVVAALVDADWLVEIEAVAFLAD